MDLTPLATWLYLGSRQGTLGDPLSEFERRRKFDDCCVPVLGEASAAVLFERCNGFKDCVDLHTFMAGLPVSGTDSVQVA